MTPIQSLFRALVLVKAAKARKRSKRVRAVNHRRSLVRVLSGKGSRR